MYFLYPEYLIGLVVISIPILLHFIHFNKPRLLPFASAQFLHTLENTVIRKLYFQNILQLLLKILAVMFLVFALARPIINSNNPFIAQNEDSIIYILIDNSPSMMQINENGSMFEQALTWAKKLIESSSPQSIFFLQKTNGENISLRPLSAVNTLNSLNTIKIEPTGTFSMAIIDEFAQHAHQNASGISYLYFLTDQQKFRPHGIDILQTPEWTNVFEEMNMITFNSVNSTNVTISNVELIEQNFNANSGNRLKVTLNYYSKQKTAFRGELILALDDSEKTMETNITIAPNQQNHIYFDLPIIPSQHYKGTLTILGDELKYDDKRYFSITLPKQLNVLYLQSENPIRRNESYLRVLLDVADNTISQLNLTTLKPSEYESKDLNRADVVIFDGVDRIEEIWIPPLIDFIQKGNGVLFLPSPTGDISNYNTFLNYFGISPFRGIKGEYASLKETSLLSRWKEGHPIFENLFLSDTEKENLSSLPFISYYLIQQPDQTITSYELLRMTNRDVLFTDYSIGEGHIIIGGIGSGLGWSNFPNHVLFAPFFYRMISYLGNTKNIDYNEHILGYPFKYTMPLISENTSVELVYNNKTSYPNVYEKGNQLIFEDNNRLWQPNWLYVNNNPYALIMDTLESNIHNTYTENQIPNWLSRYFNRVSINSANTSNLTETNSNMANILNYHPKEIWYIFLLLSMICLFIDGFYEIRKNTQ